jgi:hypothetical protein
VAAVLVRCASFKSAGDTAAADGGLDASSDGAPGDASAGDGSPCTTDAHYFCVDFDEDASLPELLPVVGGDVAIDFDAAVMPPSPPGTLVVRATPASAYPSAGKSWSASASRITVSVRARRERYDDTATDPLLVQVSGTSGAFDCRWRLRASDGHLLSSFTDGGPTTDRNSPATGDLAPQEDRWVLVTIDVLLTDATPRCELSLDGRLLGSVLLPVAVPATTFGVMIGQQSTVFAMDGGTRMRFDDLVVDVVK